MATAVATPTTPKATTSVDPLYTQAIAQAKAALAAESAPIQAEQGASDAAFQQKETDATGVATALSNLLKPIGPQVNGEYQTGAQNQELAANGFSHGMQDALQGNTDHLNEMLKSFGQPTTLDSHASQAGDMLYALGGYNPGTAFSKEGAAFGAAADLQAGDAILKGQENVKDLQAKAIVADQGFQAKIAELAGKLPGDAQSNYAKLHSLALNEAKFREQVAKDKFDAAYKTAAQKLSTAKYNTSVDEFNSRQKLAYAKFARQEFQSDRSYGVQMARLGIAQRSAQIRAATAAFKEANGGYSQKELNKLQVEATGLAHSYYDGSTSTKTYGSRTNKTGKGSTSKGEVDTQSASVTTTARIAYSAALTKLMQKGIPVQTAIRALDSVYPPTQQLNAAGLDNYLGPLSPASLAAAAARLNAQGGAVIADAASHGFMPTGAVGKFVMSPGADRSGVSTQPLVKSFVASLAGRIGTTLTIGTGTNHNEMTLDGNVSDHWTGHAADITAVGSHVFSGKGPTTIDPALTHAGQNALILAGADPAWARRQTGGLFDIDTLQGRVQIIFNSFQGGNHYNHLHVGVK